jgi:hypothetical protein
MRLSNAFFILFGLLLASCSSPKTTAQFYHEHKHQEGVTNFKLPGWVVWLGGGLAYNSVRNEDARMFLKLARKVGKMRFLTSEDATAIASADIEQFLGNIRQNGYEDLLHVKDAQSNFTILVKDNKQRLKSLVILGYDDGDLVYFDLKSRLKYSDITTVVDNILSGDYKKNRPQEASEEEPEPQEDKRA